MQPNQQGGTSQNQNGPPPPVGSQWFDFSAYGTLYQPNELMQYYNTIAAQAAQNMPLASQQEQHWMQYQQMLQNYQNNLNNGNNGTTTSAPQQAQQEAQQQALQQALQQAQEQAEKEAKAEEEARRIAQAREQAQHEQAAAFIENSLDKMTPTQRRSRFGMKENEIAERREREREREKKRDRERERERERKHGRSRHDTDYKMRMRENDETRKVRMQKDSDYESARQTGDGSTRANRRDDRNNGKSRQHRENGENREMRNKRDKSKKKREKCKSNDDDSDKSGRQTRHIRDRIGNRDRQMFAKMQNEVTRNENDGKDEMSSKDERRKSQEKEERGSHDRWFDDLYCQLVAISKSRLGGFIYRDWRSSCKRNVYATCIANCIGLLSVCDDVVRFLILKDDWRVTFETLSVKIVKLMKIENGWITNDARTTVRLKIIPLLLKMINHGNGESLASNSIKRESNENEENDKSKSKEFDNESWNTTSRQQHRDRDSSGKREQSPSARDNGLPERKRRRKEHGWSKKASTNVLKERRERERERNKESDRDKDRHNEKAKSKSKTKNGENKYGNDNDRAGDREDRERERHREKQRNKDNDRDKEKERESERHNDQKQKSKDKKDRYVDYHGTKNEMFEWFEKLFECCHFKDLFEMIKYIENDATILLNLNECKNKVHKVFDVTGWDIMQKFVTVLQIFLNYRDLVYNVKHSYFHARNHKIFEYNQSKHEQLKQVGLVLNETFDYLSNKWNESKADSKSKTNEEARAKLQIIGCLRVACKTWQSISWDISGKTGLLFANNGIGTVGNRSKKSTHLSTLGALLEIAMLNQESTSISRLSLSNGGTNRSSVGRRGMFGFMDDLLRFSKLRFGIDDKEIDTLGTDILNRLSYCPNEVESNVKHLLRLARRMAKENETGDVVSKFELKRDLLPTQPYFKWPGIEKGTLQDNALNGLMAMILQKLYGNEVGNTGNVNNNNNSNETNEDGLSALRQRALESMKRKRKKMNDDDDNDIDLANNNDHDVDDISLLISKIDEEMTQETEKEIKENDNDFDIDLENNNDIDLLILQVDKEVTQERRKEKEDNNDNDKDKDKDNNKDETN